MSKVKIQDPKLKVKIQDPKLKIELKKIYQDFLDNPQNHFAEEDQQKVLHTFRNMSEEGKNHVWKEFERITAEQISARYPQETFSKLYRNDKDYIAQDIIENIAEVTSENLKHIIKHPNKHKHLETSTIKYLQNASSKEKNTLFTEIAEEKGLEVSKLPYSQSKFLKFFQNSWQKIAPIVVDAGVKALSALIDEKIGGNAGSGALRDLVEGVGGIVREEVELTGSDEIPEKTTE